MEKVFYSSLKKKSSKFKIVKRITHTRPSFFTFATETSINGKLLKAETDDLNDAITADDNEMTKLDTHQSKRIMIISLVYVTLLSELSQSCIFSVRDAKFKFQSIKKLQIWHIFSAPKGLIFKIPPKLNTYQFSNNNG